MTELKDVGVDIVSDILSRLPAESLLRLRRVCKGWKGIIDDQIFVKSNTKKQQSSPPTTILIRNKEDGALFCLSLDSIEIELNVIPLKQIIPRGVPRLSECPTLSCNGLILISHDNINDIWAIWNPLLQHFHLLPPPPQTDVIRYGSFLETCGFGYDEGFDDYKVVRVDGFYRRKVNGYRYRTRLYSMKSRFWRAFDDFPGHNCLGGRGAFLDGSLYWGSPEGVVALDLGTEVHRLVTLPPPSMNIYCGSLYDLDGCLIWSCEGHYRMKAWVMEADYSWTELYSVAFNMTIVGYLKSKGQVFFNNWGASGLRCFDLKSKSWRDISNSGVFSPPNPPLSFTQISPMTLVRVDDDHKMNTTVECVVKLKSKREMKRDKAYTKKMEICGGRWKC